MLTFREDRIAFTPLESSLEDSEAGLADGGRFLLCARCGLRVTQEGNRIIVQGNHEHRFFNPHGLIFELGCFDSAPGCAPVGEPTMEFTWFPGHAWQATLCLGCLNHLGWLYASAAARGFFGLILDRLVEEHDQGS